MFDILFISIVGSLILGCLFLLFSLFITANIPMWVGELFSDR